MKRFLTILLSLLLLAGCQQTPQDPPAAETTATTEPDFSLLEQAEAVGTTGNLLYIPNAHVESMVCPEMRLYGNGLLLYEQGMDGMLKLMRISLEDGSLLAEAAYPVSPAAQVQIGSGAIGICDSSTGQVLILNESLQTETAYAFASEDAYWYLNQELETLFMFRSEEGLLYRDLASGQTRWILDHTAFLKPIGTGNGYVLFSYTDREDQKTYVRHLDLSTATMQTLPVDGRIQAGVRSGEQWLLRRSVLSGEYLLIDQGQVGTFTWPEGYAALPANRGQLFVIDGNYRDLYLYDLNGAFLSRCALPRQEYASVGTDLIWSGYWQGYFFRDTYDNAAHLMFWNIGVSQEGEAFSIAPVGAAQAPEPVMEPALYEKAAALSERYGLDIRIAEQCALDYADYKGAILENPYFVREALDTLEKALGAYPEGFFRQLPYGDMHRIRIELATDLKVKDTADTYPPIASGVASQTDDCYLIVLDGYFLQEGTVYHEFSHIIDKRLEWDARLRPEALFSEETWLSYQPEGFRYAEAYSNLPADVQAFENSGYFARSYALTFPTEDRATLMSLAITDPIILENSPGMLEKMRYYAACIRDCFDTEGWPAETAWE